MPYEFTTEAWEKFTQDIFGANGDQATLTTVMADMGDTFTAGITTSGENQRNYERISAENERLKTANMNLFLRVGEQTKQEHTGGGEKEREVEPGHAVDSFMDNLFKEKEK